MGTSSFRQSPWRTHYLGLFARDDSSKSSCSLCFEAAADSEFVFSAMELRLTSLCICILSIWTCLVLMMCIRRIKRLQISINDTSAVVHLGRRTADRHAQTHGVGVRYWAWAPDSLEHPVVSGSVHDDEQNPDRVPSTGPRLPSRDEPEVPVTTAAGEHYLLHKL